MATYAGVGRVPGAVLCSCGGPGGLHRRRTSSARARRRGGAPSHVLAGLSRPSSTRTTCPRHRGRPKAALDFINGYLTSWRSRSTTYLFVLIFTTSRCRRSTSTACSSGRAGALVMRGVMIGAGAVRWSASSGSSTCRRLPGVHRRPDGDAEGGGLRAESTPRSSWCGLPSGERRLRREALLHPTRPSRGACGAWPRPCRGAVCGGDHRLIFAVDSIPAIFGVTRDPFIVFTRTCSPFSACLAYFMLASVIDASTT